MVDNIGKKYSGRWIFRNLSCRVEKGVHTAILGKNGAGKSTLLKIISGYITPNEGSIMVAGKLIDPAIVAFNAPYIDFPEEMTLRELTDFYFSFKKLIPATRPETVFDECGLLFSMSHRLNSFSSGMKQKVKLSLSFLTSAEIYLFDEPSSHLDDQSVKWFRSRISTISKEAFVFIGSNSEITETTSCSFSIKLS